MAFNENDHPRAKDGKFAPKGSGNATGGAKETTTKTKEIEIDDDYERAYGPAPDREESPNEYDKYIKSYKKWQKGETNNDTEEGNKESKTNTNYNEFFKKDYKELDRAGVHFNVNKNDFDFWDVDDMRKGMEILSKNHGARNVYNSGLHVIVDTDVEDDEEERRQAYKLFDLDF